MQIRRQLTKWFHKRNKPKNNIKKRNVKQYHYFEGKGKEYFMYSSRKGRPLKITDEELFFIIDLHKQRKNKEYIFDAKDWHHNISLSTVGIVIQRYKQGCFDKCLIDFTNSEKFEDKELGDYLEIGK